MSIFKSVANYIRAAKYADALLFLESEVSDIEDTQSILLIRNNYNSLLKKNINGIIKQSDYTIEENRISKRILDLAILLDHADAKAAESEQVERKRNIKLILEKLLELLEANMDGFKGQIIIRNQLKAAVTKRLNIKGRSSYEDFFATHYSKMNDSEKEMHLKIRSYTENVINIYNRKVLLVLMSQKKLEQVIPELALLKRHLHVWIGKYENVFMKNPEIGIVYTAIKERVGFPKGIELKIQEYLENN